MMFIYKLFYIYLGVRRIFGLDLLRACAILFVLVEHGDRFVSKPFKVYSSLLSFDGVSVFFVLSGFLIGGILIKTLDRKPATRSVLFDFWIKRWLRTVPPYILTLVVVMLLDSFSAEFKLTYYKLYPFFLQNLAWEHPYVFMEAWSLSVEEWFYLLIPPAVFLLIRLGLGSSKSLLVTAASVLILSTAYRYYKYAYMPPMNELAWDQDYRKVVVMRLDSIMYGVIAAYLKFYIGSWWPKYRTSLLVVGLALFALTRLPFNYAAVYGCVWYFSLCSLSVMLMLPFMSTWETAAGFVPRLLTRISLISYSLYLLNFSIVGKRIVYPLLLHLNLTETNTPLGYACFWMFTLFLAILMYNYFEIPVMNLRSRFVNHRNEVLAASK